MKSEYNLILEGLIKNGEIFFSNIEDKAFSNKRCESSWSKKEILGHLIDSALYNIRRFTEVKFAPQPYVIETYKQDRLVEINGYQHAELKDLVILWCALNKRISTIIASLTKEDLNLKIILKNGEGSDVEFLIDDYIKHLIHHLDQIYQN